MADGFELRCHWCSHRLGFTTAVSRCVALFKASVFGRVAPAHSNEIRKRCSSCGMVNVFHPATSAERDWRAVEVKKRATA